MPNDNRIDAIRPLQGFPANLRRVPPNYPTRPVPGKISLLFKSNERQLYRTLSPYTNYDSILNFLPNKQPFVYKYPGDDGPAIGSLPSKFKLLESQAFPIKDTLDDLVRIGKFSISSAGVLFYIKQGVLQTMNPYPETRLYNPLSVMLSVGRPATLGLLPRVARHINIQNGITAAIGSAFGFNTAALTAPGAVSLPKESSDGGHGLIRSPNAGKAYYNLQTKWAKSTTSTGIPSFIESIKNSMKSLFLSTNLINTSYKTRPDEKAYELMISSNRFDLVQSWFTSRGSNVNNRKKFIPAAGGTFSITDLLANGGLKGKDLFIRKGFSVINSPTGYEITDTKTKYGDYVKIANEGEFTNSEVLVNYANYTSEAPANNQSFWKTKFDNPKSIGVETINSSLKRLINGIETAGYSVKTEPGSRALSAPQTDPVLMGYNAIGRGKYLNEYSNNTQTLDTHQPRSSKKLSTTNRSDGINRISIIGKDRKLINNGSSAEKIPLDDFTGWEEWKPYEDDIIAFYFYDIVNEKYIPFRATVKGISEGGTAFWDELRFIGRADQVYSYSGFSRTLSFTFNIVVSSIKELLPTWRKINYMAGCVKPSNYTNSGGVAFDRFMVPPMFMLTIGDLYKFQPIVIKSITINIPDDASWETLNELNNPTEDWNYLKKIISSNIIGKNYAQLPREAEIAITCDVLEKERAIVGNSNFGHAPHTDDYTEGVFISSNNTPFLPEPTEFHKNMVEYNGETNPSLNLRGRIDSQIDAQTKQSFLIAGSESAVPQQTTSDPTKLPTTSGIKAAKSIV